jgi:hypothetical protein
MYRSAAKKHKAQCEFDSMELASEWDRKHVQTLVKAIATDCIAKKRSNNGRLPHQFWARLQIDNPQYAEMGIKLHTIRNCIDRMGKKGEIE